MNSFSLDEVLGLLEQIPFALPSPTPEQGLSPPPTETPMP